MTQRLSINNVNIEGYHTKVIPGLHFHEDGKSLTITAMTLEKPGAATDSDRFLSMEECRNFLSNPVTTVNLKYEAYTDLFVKYKDFPGWHMPIFEVFNAIIKIRMKKTFDLFKQNPIDKNFTGFIKYTGDNFSTFDSTSGIVMGSLLKFDDFPEEEKQYRIVPTTVINLPANKEINLIESNFVLFHSDPGYYCNLELEEKTFGDFMENSLNNIVVEDNVKRLLINES